MGGKDFVTFIVAINLRAVLCDGTWNPVICLVLIRKFVLLECCEIDVDSWQLYR